METSAWAGRWEKGRWTLAGEVRWQFEDAEVGHVLAIGRWAVGRLLDDAGVFHSSRGRFTAERLLRTRRWIRRGGTPA